MHLRTKPLLPGVVQLWGVVHEHEDGYRAQYGRLEALLYPRCSICSLHPGAIITGNLIICLKCHDPAQFPEAIGLGRVATDLGVELRRELLPFPGTKVPKVWRGNMAIEAKNYAEGVAKFLGLKPEDMFRTAERWRRAIDRHGQG